MKILVTGGAGFIGSHVVEHFQGRAEIVVLDNLRSGHLSNLAGLEHQFIEGSITDTEVVRNAMEGVDLVFHLAAMISVPESMQKPSECVEINVLGLLNVLEAAAAARVRKVVHASSAAIYGDNPTVPKTEDMLPEPKSPYAITKLDGEYYLEMFRSERELDTVSLRFFNVFGPRQDPKSAYAAAVPIFIEKALAGEPLTIFGDGDQTRDFIFVKDVVAALEHVSMQPNVHGSLNVGYGRSMTVNMLAEAVSRLTGNSTETVHLGERVGDVKHSRASINKLIDAGFSHQGSLEQGLAETVHYFKDQGMRRSKADS